MAQLTAVATGGGREIAPAKGKLGVMLVGLGAVSTTFIAGVENVRRGRAQPIGSLSQMATIRLGKRTEKRSPKIKEFIPLADLNDLVFAAWDPIPDDAYTAARKAGVLDPHEHLDPIKPFLQAIKPLPAVFDQYYVKRLHTALPETHIVVGRWAGASTDEEPVQGLRDAGAALVASTLVEVRAYLEGLPA